MKVQAPFNDQRLKAVERSKADAVSPSAQRLAQRRIGQHIAPRTEGNDGYVHIVNEVL